MEVELKEELIGEWIEELCGTDLLYLQPVTERSRLRINLCRWDGILGVCPAR